MGSWAAGQQHVHAMFTCQTQHSSALHAMVCMLPAAPCQLCMHAAAVTKHGKHTVTCTGTASTCIPAVTSIQANAAIHTCMQLAAAAALDTSCCDFNAAQHCLTGCQYHSMVSLHEVSSAIRHVGSSGTSKRTHNGTSSCVSTVNQHYH